MGIDNQTMNLLGCLDADGFIELLGAMTYAIQNGGIALEQRARIATFMVRFGCSTMENLGYHAAASMVHPSLGMAITYQTQTGETSSEE